jgi:ribonuclease VapC
MIVVDTSALMAIVLGEPAAATCKAALEDADEIVISAVTLTEALVVSAGRNVGAEMSELIEGLGCEVFPVGETQAKRAADAYARWGRGNHPAGLNFADTFAYALAKERACTLLFVGDDFGRTDVERAA